MIWFMCMERRKDLKVSQVVIADGLDGCLFIGRRKVSWYLLLCLLAHLFQFRMTVLLVRSQFVFHCSLGKMSSHFCHYWKSNVWKSNVAQLVNSSLVLWGTTGLWKLYVEKNPVCAQVTSCPCELVCDDKEEINKQKKAYKPIMDHTWMQPPSNKQ